MCYEQPDGTVQVVGNAVTDGTCQKWSAKLHAGDFSTDDAPQLGRPIEVDSNQSKDIK